MKFLKGKSLLIVGLGLFALSSLAYVGEDINASVDLDCLYLQSASTGETVECIVGNENLKGKRITLDENMPAIKYDFSRRYGFALDHGSVTATLNDAIIKIQTDQLHLVFKDQSLKNTVVVFDFESNERPIDFSGANFSGATVRRSIEQIRSGVRDIENVTADWTGAKYDEDTRFPEGFNPEEHGMVFVEKKCYFRGC